MHQTFTRTYPDGTRGNYKVAPGSELPLALATLKPHRMKRQKDRRQFPKYVPGWTSTSDYVRQYYELNELGSTGHFDPLRDEPAHGYTGIDTIKPEGGE